jgi:DNA-binding MarR family transcriptional regulator
MTPSLIDEAGILAISTRLQRLSEQLRKDCFSLYKARGIDFEPKWFPVIYALHCRPVLSVVEIAAEIGYTHPSTISLLKELEKQKLIRSKRDKQDERKRLLQLTDKGKALVARMQPVWQVLTAVLTTLTDTPNNLMASLREVEAGLHEKSFLERLLAHTNSPSL